jgi:hypothetical protein
LAGIRAAHQLGIPTGGWIPKGWLTEHGPRPEYGPLYGATEHASPDWKPRTVSNVRDSDATILFRSCRAKTHRGCNLTAQACARLNKPALVVPVWSTPDRVPTTARVAGLIRAKGFRSINVAGSRGSSDPAVAGVPGSGIEAWVFAWCLDLFMILKG